MTDDQEDIVGQPEYVTGASDIGPDVPMGAATTREEIEGRIMMEGVLPSFLTATRAAAEGHPEAEELQNALIASLEQHAAEERARQEAGEEDKDEAEESAALWSAAADLCRAVFIEHRSALDLVAHSQELDKHPEYPWKVLCVLCYLGGSTDQKTSPFLAINLHMAVVEYVYGGTHHIPELYEEVITGWFCAYWQRVFENARFHFQGPKIVEMDLQAALQSDVNVRLQRVLRAMAFGLGASLPERGREWFQRTD